MTDNCPECLARDVSASGAIRFGGTVLALHACPSCGHQWTCSWDAASLDPDPKLVPAPAAHIRQLCAGVFPKPPKEPK